MGMLEKTRVLRRDASKKGTITTDAHTEPENNFVQENSKYVEPVLKTGLEPRTKEEHRIVGGRLPDILPFQPQRMPEGSRRPGRWAKGSSGNPEGGRITTVHYIRRISADGLEMATHAFRCMRGSMVIQRMNPQTGEVQEALVPSNGKEQAEARAFLVKQGLIDDLKEAIGEVTLNYSALTPDEARELLRLQKKMEAARNAAQITEGELVTPEED